MIQILIIILLLVLLGSNIYLLIVVRKIKREQKYINYRIDPIRFDFLCRLRSVLIDQERFEEVECVDEMIKEEFGEIDNISDLV